MQSLTGKNIVHFASDIVCLRTAKARFIVFASISCLLYMLPYSLIERAKLSLYERMHIPAPSIGLTRAYWKLIHGDLAGAWHRNKLIYVVVGIIIGIMVADLVTLLKKKPSAAEAPSA